MDADMVAWLKSQRTLSQREVDERTAKHDAGDWTPEERRTYTVAA